MNFGSCVICLWCAGRPGQARPMLVFFGLESGAQFICQTPRFLWDVKTYSLYDVHVVRRYVRTYVRTVELIIVQLNCFDPANHFILWPGQLRWEKTMLLHRSSCSNPCLSFWSQNISQFETCTTSYLMTKPPYMTYGKKEATKFQYLRNNI